MNKQQQFLASQDHKIVLYHKQYQEKTELLSYHEDITLKKKKYLKNYNKNKENPLKIDANIQSNQIIDKQIQNEQKYFNENNLDQTQQALVDGLFDLNNKKLQKYQSQKYKIYQKLLKKNYTLQSYLNSGGQADIFNGYFQNINGIKQEYVFKIYFEATDKEFRKEIEIMKSFEQTINIVKIIDSLSIDQFYILVLEECKYSLKQELTLFKERKKIFSFNKLLQILFDLLDGLIQFRIYNVLHLDIKPGNILLSKNGKYCYSDFGTSFNIKKNKQIKVISITKVYASPEQIQNFESKNFQPDKSIDFQSDIYSLGVTLKRVINIFKDVNEDYLQNQKMKDIIESFEKVIQQNMILTESSQRQECKNLHQQFLQYLNTYEYLDFFYNYKKKLIQITNLNEYDQNKDFLFFQKLKLIYNLIYLDLIKNYYQNFFSMSNFISTAQQNARKYPHYFDVGINYISKRYIIDIPEMIKQIPEGNHPDIASSLSNIGDCYVALGDYQNGLKYLQESLEMKKQLFQGEHPDIAFSLCNVGQCYQSLGDYQNGLKYQLESLKMRKEIFQGDHLDVAQSLNYIGQFYINLCDNQNGLKYLQESLRILKQNFKRKHPLIAQSLNNIGQCYQNLGENGMKYLLESLEMMKLTIQQRYPIFVSILYNVGQGYKQNGDNQKGLKYLLESLEMGKQIFQGNRPSTATTLQKIGECFVNIGDYQNGMKYFLKSLQIIKIFQNLHPDIATTLNDVGYCYINLGDNQNCLTYYLQSLEMRKQIFQERHKAISLSLNNVGFCYLNLGQIKNGLKYLLESLEMKKQIFHGNNHSIATTFDILGQCYKKNGDNQKGLKYSLVSLQILKQIFLQNHSDTALSLNNVGQCYMDLGDIQNGLKYSLESLLMMKQIFKKNLPNNIYAILQNVMFCYFKLNNKQKGESILYKNLKI